MTELFPTFGYPMNPTETVFLSLWKFANYLSNFIKLSLPNYWLVPALNAMVGWN